MSRETQGNATQYNPQGQKVRDGGKGGKMKDFGFEDGKVSGVSGKNAKSTPNSGNKSNTPDGQIVTG